MLIINNNCSQGKSRYSDHSKFMEKNTGNWPVAFFWGNRRSLYVFLLLTVPWSGAAHFYVGRLLFGIISIMLTSLSVPGMILLFVGFIHPPLLWNWIVPLLSAILAPWLYGIIAGVYWSLRTDKEFETKFCGQR